MEHFNPPSFIYCENACLNWINNCTETGCYSFTQSFVGGAAIGYGGVATYKKTSGKLLRAMERGSFNLGMQFAHTDRDKFNKTFFNGDPIGIVKLGSSSFASYFAGDIVSGYFGDLAKNRLTENVFKLNGIKQISFNSMEYFIDVFSRSGYPLNQFPDKKDNKWLRKASIIGFKSVFYTFIF
jgi:hypothetical protein